MTEWAVAITIEASLWQSAKAREPMLLTESGITTEARLGMPLKALSGIEVIECGITTDVKLVQPNASSPMLVTESGITSEPTGGVGKPGVTSWTRLRHPSKASTPMLVAPKGTYAVPLVIGH